MFLLETNINTDIFCWICSCHPAFYENHQHFPHLIHGLQNVEHQKSVQVNTVQSIAKFMPRVLLAIDMVLTTSTLHAAELSFERVISPQIL
jgi:hypothetical protein